ncbi:MAG: hypothetical protein HQ567_28265 [Candidatus Nealsonbacteria bacterium]|nr:hypothetical protein [Candidatus Nealsonbacteria bacterium]
MRNGRNSTRRGVILVVILGLLAMFGLVAVAFVVLANHARFSAQAVQRIGQYEERPKQTLHGAFVKFLVGEPVTVSPTGEVAANRASVMSWDIGLLGDMYGNEYFTGTMSGGSPICGGQLFEFDPGNMEPSRKPYHIGCVLTMLDGSAVGQSTRIVGVNPQTGLFQALAFDEGTPLPANGNQFLINGVPFSGTGFGWTQGSGASLGQSALIPRHENNLYPLGGANEDYDAVDFQNPHLAGQMPIIGANGTITGVRTIPSFHRPALVKYWQTNGDMQNPDVRRQVILRPLGAGSPQPDHPMFTGSNPNPNGVFDPLSDWWDVDNDGDGFTDSIWVDMGMPVRSTADGRMYKPLFAILCIDMDGRLNINVHGTATQADAASYKQGTYEYVDATAPQGYRFAGTTSVPLPRGLGTGPAEINLLPLFQHAGNNSYLLYRRLLCGEQQWYLEGRYGELNTAANGVPMPGVTGLDDPLSANRMFEYAGGYWNFFQGTEMLDSYGSPLDLYGTGAIALDPAGRPLPVAMAQNVNPVNQTTAYLTDDPYEIDPSLKRGRGMGVAVSPGSNIDNPFSVAEWERINRPFDRDADTLPPRLAALTNDGSGGPLRSMLLHSRHSFTTDSWDLPCPGLGISPDGQRVRHVVDLLRVRGTPQDSLLATAHQLLPPEMLAGLRMNLNRPLGSGRDDNDNDVVDEAREAASGEQFPQYATPTNGGQFPFDHANDNYGDSSPSNYDPYAREIMARHLYVLMWMTADAQFLTTQLGSAEEASRFLAQWAVNIVDFRDRDSIMTRFRYDVNPFNGWEPDGSALHTVWGCERPELLITETLAMHDRRTEDRDDEQHDPSEEGDNSEEAGKTTDGGEGEGEGDEKKKDASFDQRLRPEGSLFVELFNPWTALQPRAGELHLPQSSGRGVHLNRVSGGTGGSPVWRLLICPRPDGVEADEEQLDPDDPDPTKRPDVDRVVYFVPSTAATIPQGGPQGGRVRFTPSQNPLTQVLPGRYCVIGPGNSAQGAATTYIGFRTGQDAGDGTTRRIVLQPGGSDKEVVKNDTSTNPHKPAAAQVHPPSVMVINTPRRLSVSEPVDGYTADGYADGAYAPPRDIPLDAERDDEVTANNFTADGTFFGFRVVHLQRLANPLQAYDAEENPYRTIDSMPIDLTAFNGVTNDEDPQNGGSMEDVRLHARQRGEEEGDAEANTNNLWKQQPMAKLNGDKEIGGALNDHYMNKPMRHSLGYLNAEFFGAPLSDNNYRGDPPRPFPWLTWNNRPFVSQMELLLVPGLRSSKLLVHNRQNPNMYYSIAKTGVAVDPYQSTTPEQVPFQHLPNLFHSASSQQPGLSSQLHRLLEFVHVPSPFVGTNVQINPNVSTTGQHSFHPPFNLVSRYRDPGRINLNTIFTRQTYLGLMNCFPGTNTEESWNRFVRSRNPGGQGGGRVIGDPTTLGSSSPSQFSHPFRTATGGSLVPQVGSLRFENEIGATLLRADPEVLGQPLFRNDTASTEINSPNNPDRNPYFRYQALQRLGNLTTTRSNVYAIWITVGYFEVKPVGVDPVRYPDGYQLATELGVDTGEVERHRAFYMFDRSIPVGYIRGQDLNVEKAILVKRFIE